MNSIKKVVVIGPESTGKSTLCSRLAMHYGTDWVPEYAREYLLKHGINYHFEHLLEIAEGQLQLEQQRVNKLIETGTINNQIVPLFVDTDMYVMKVWCEFVFGQCHSWILNRLVEQDYDLYLLANVDAPWVKDELREYPDLATRTKLYHHYKDALVQQKVPWVDISGDYEERFRKAVTAVDNLLRL